MTSSFGLFWPGKEDALKQASLPAKASASKASPTQTDFSHPDGNILYAGDNLDALKSLAAHSPASVDVIYIDPPYNTGRDFLYRDNYRNRREHRSTDHGQWHAQWLSMMTPRLILAWQLLAPTGHIFISIGEDEVAHLRMLADELFGQANFANQFIWKKGGTGKNDSRFAITEHEYVLAYARSAESPGFNTDPQGHTTTKYNFHDDKGAYSLVRLDSKTLGYVPSLDFAIHDAEGQEYLPHQPAGQTQVARWRWSKEKVAEHYEDLVFRRGFVYTKNYQKQGARPRSILDGERFGVTRSGRRDAESALGISGIFDFPKPVRLIKYLVDIGGPKDAKVLDFFAGSGTTAQAVAELNEADGGTRTVQLMQLPEPTAKTSAAHRAGFETIADICWARMHAAGLQAQRIELS